MQLLTRAGTGLLQRAKHSSQPAWTCTELGCTHGAVGNVDKGVRMLALEILVTSLSDGDRIYFRCALEVT